MGPGADRELRSAVLTAALALAVVLLTLDRGGYGLGSRGAGGVLLWWLLLGMVAFGVWPRSPVPRAALVTGALLCAFCALTGASALWADSAENAFVELGRVGLYLGVFAIVVAAAGRGSAAAWTDGMGVAIAAVAFLALADRCFSWHDPSDLRSLLPGTEVRLGYPLGYWNGLGILFGIGVPLLLRPAVASSRAVVRGAAVAALPALGGGIYLTSSRGGAAAAAVGAIAFAGLAGRPLWAIASLGTGAAGTFLAVVVLDARPELVDGPLDSAAALSQGESAAPLLLLVCLACGLAYALLSTTLLSRIRVRRGAALAAGAAALVLVLAGAVAADPADRFEDFKAPPNEQTTDRPGFVRDHLLSGEGSGRWQFWSAALDQFEEHPLAGDGAGSYEAWWLRHGSLAFYAKDAHSLYLETLGELGVLGLALLAGALLATFVVAARRLGAAAAELRPAVAAAAAALAAFAVGAAVDWIWELTVIGMIGATCIGLLTGPASAADRGGSARSPGRRRPLMRVALGLIALCMVAVEAIPWMVDRQLGASRDALSAGDAAAAQTRALEARSLQPWAASPHRQLALVREHEGDLEGARLALARALELEPDNWELWVISARIKAAQGLLRQARSDLSRARRLHPRSPLFDYSEADRARLGRALGGQ